MQHAPPPPLNGKQETPRATAYRAPGSVLHDSNGRPRGRYRARLKPLFDEEDRPPSPPAAKGGALLHHSPTRAVSSVEWAVYRAERGKRPARAGAGRDRDVFACKRPT